MFVPPGCPHAFYNPGPAPVRMLFLVSPPGHERFFEEMGELLAGSAAPDQAATAALRARHDIHQLTPVVPNRLPDPDGQLQLRQAGETPRFPRNEVGKADDRNQCRDRRADPAGRPL
jgi:hypothetical protein